MLKENYQIAITEDFKIYDKMSWELANILGWKVYFDQYHDLEYTFGGDYEGQFNSLEDLVSVLRAKARGSYNLGYLSSIVVDEETSQYTCEYKTNQGTSTIGKSWLPAYAEIQALYILFSLYSDEELKLPKFIDNDGEYDLDPVYWEEEE